MADPTQHAPTSRATNADVKRWLPQRPLEWSVIALAFVLHSAFFAWFPALRSPNELTRVYLTRALLEERSVQIDAQIQKHTRIFDLSERRIDGKLHYYSDKAPGLSFWSLPAVALYDAVSAQPTLDGSVRVMRWWSCTLPTLLLLFLLLAFLRDELREPDLPALLVLTYAFGTVAAPYASLAYGHQLSAVLLFASFLAIRKLTPDAPWWKSIVVGVGASFAILVEYQNVLLLVPFAFFFLYQVRCKPLHLLFAFIGALPLMLLLFAYHQAAFGSPFATGYSFLASSFKSVHAQGMLGVGFPTAAHAYLSFLSPDKGLFFFSPCLALAVPGLWLAFRSGRTDLRFGVVFVVMYALFVSALIYPVGGWTVSQRHLVPAVPFMLLPCGLLIERLDARMGLGRVLFVGLALPSVFVLSVSAIVWPHFQEEIANPFWQLGWPLFRDGYLPPSLLNAIGVPSRVLACVLMGSAALLLLAGVVRIAKNNLQRVALPVVAIVIGLAFVALAREPGSEQDMRRHRRFVERLYVLDPLATPTPFGKR